MPSADVEDLRKQLAAHGQEHLLKFWSRLNVDQKSHLVSEIQSVDFGHLNNAYRETVANRENNNQKLDQLLEPIPEELHEGVSRCTPEQLRSYREAGKRNLNIVWTFTVVRESSVGSNISLIKHWKFRR